MRGSHLRRSHAQPLQRGENLSAPPLPRSLHNPHDVLLRSLAQPALPSALLERREGDLPRRKGERGVGEHERVGGAHGGASERLELLRAGRRRPCRARLRHLPVEVEEEPLERALRRVHEEVKPELAQERELVPEHHSRVLLDALPKVVRRDGVLLNLARQKDAREHDELWVVLEDALPKEEALKVDERRRRNECGKAKRAAHLHELGLVVLQQKPLLLERQRRSHGRSCAV
mmetsp:Transcript_28851/g.94293  ORF Transcript_28851/g.94293 Transcript_28851/m.94293 type:complete len:232 (+) Transcript_28851:603-1298(+)